jgi:hypothetical protein
MRQMALPQRRIGGKVTALDFFGGDAQLGRPGGQPARRALRARDAGVDTADGDSEAANFKSFATETRLSSKRGRSFWSFSSVSALMRVWEAPRFVGRN